MNTMNMPGFTAEASLSKQGKFYRLPATYVSDSFGVQPQLRKTDFECVHDCLEAGGGDICNFFCTENVDPGGGGGGGQPKFTNYTVKLENPWTKGDSK